jgi:RNA-binding protein 39
MLEECSKFGPVVHIYVDKRDRNGMVYMKYVSANAATLARNTMHGRFFGGRQLTAQIMPEDAYYSRFPEAQRVRSALRA